ncbi:dimethylargininase [Marinactinospora thermotolerans]|uniref:Dimethylargininase n=1 Tax=Marinactinospora thermotolerans DSM 45154 TaxID=1122192 RepID=A0A1T4K391_9ACTN|nr:dimethylargininase [Marinactinospora thermotolerans]SJZ36922.1 dimethylargininase [Marinactinospora thermotolerans DSM 45154]
MPPGDRVALVRRPGPRLEDGLVTHVRRRPVDAALAARQHAAYRDALARSGRRIHEVAPDDALPDAVFVEDALVVCDRLAILTRSGAPRRRAEVAGVERAVAALGLETARIEAPATLDGGDVLQVGATVYVGLGGRTDGRGAAALRALLEPLGRTVVPVRTHGVLHLKSAVTALPDGTLIGRPDAVDTAVLPPVRAVAEETGAHVLPLGGDEVLIGASAPRTAADLRGLGYRTRVVDIGEFEKLEGCVTCLSVLVGA